MRFSQWIFDQEAKENKENAELQAKVKVEVQKLLDLKDKLKIAQEK